MWQFSASDDSRVTDKFTKTFRQRRLETSLKLTDQGRIMHFGEYLVQRKVLSAHQILKGLAEQHRRRKFIPLLLVELGALADHRALHFCTIADQDHAGFLQVLLHEGFISEKQYAQINDSWMRSGPPLGQLLVELGLMDTRTCAELLEDYEAEKALEENLAKML